MMSTPTARTVVPASERDGAMADRPCAAVEPIAGSVTLQKEPPGLHHRDRIGVGLLVGRPHDVRGRVEAERRPPLDRQYVPRDGPRILDEHPAL